jgi:hypothetical protein
LDSACIVFSERYVVVANSRAYLKKYGGYVKYVMSDVVDEV